MINKDIYIDETSSSP